MCATWAFESGGQALSLCGCFRENAFTDSGERRSELPSRSTGFTALPRTFAYRAWRAFSASSFGASG